VEVPEAADLRTPTVPPRHSMNRAPGFDSLSTIQFIVSDGRNIDMEDTEPIMIRREVGRPPLVMGYEHD
jgi:hypothetical protein